MHCLNKLSIFVHYKHNVITKQNEKYIKSQKYKSSVHTYMNLLTPRFVAAPKLTISE